MSTASRSAPSGVEDVVGRLAAGTVGAVELLAQTVDRIAAQDDGPSGLRAVIATSPRARSAAEAADRRRRDGRARSPLDGVPVLVKDCIETVDLPTTHGSTLFATWRARRDAGAVSALRRAGAVIAGTASLDDFAAATVGSSSLRGTMLNPADPTRTVGGSSGGSASAVAAGYVPLALGTDTGGSLRIPAAACGVVTIRPTPGRVPTDGVFPRSFGQDAVGPLATSVTGAAWGLTVLATVRGPAWSARPAGSSGDQAGSGRGAWSAVGPGGRTSWVGAASAGRDDPSRALAGLRFGVVRGGLAAWGDDPTGPVVALLDLLVGRLDELGVEVVEVPAPDRGLLSASALVTLESAAAVDRYLAERPGAPVRTFAELWRSQEFTEAAGVALEREMAWSGRDPGAARRAALDSRRDLREWTAGSWAGQGVDLVLYPTAQRVAGPAGREQDGVYSRWAEHADLPALSLPVGGVRRADGTSLPASAELVARPFQEGLLFRAAGAIETLVRDQGPVSSQEV